MLYPSHPICFLNPKKYILFFFSLFLFLLFSIPLFPQIPDGYYDHANGKREAELKTTLHHIIRVHTYLNYDKSTKVWWYTYFNQTDRHPDGYFWDMYSSEKRSVYNGRILNREHCLPRSWWSVSANYSRCDANGDLYNLSPADSKANSAKSNYPLGIVGAAKFDNGTSKVGSNIFPDYDGIVFEPDDEYKGDFARIYMYMVTCYEDYVDDWRGTGITSMLCNDTYPTLSRYTIRLLLKWHDEDPVSEKEMERNNNVYTLQGNRNPFVDCPEYGELIWGSLNNND